MNTSPLYSNLLKSYQGNCQFQVKVQNATSAIYPIKSGMPQESVLGSTLYVLLH